MILILEFDFFIKKIMTTILKIYIHTYFEFSFFHKKIKIQFGKNKIDSKDNFNI